MISKLYRDSLYLFMSKKMNLKLFLSLFFLKSQLLLLFLILIRADFHLCIYAFVTFSVAIDKFHSVASHFIHVR